MQREEEGERVSENSHEERENEIEKMEMRSGSGTKLKGGPTWHTI